ncbi:hypothetical protein CUJ84_Chr001377 [Rhizobium leguminosarum]|uniref:Uncharacterized protein n=1 Tax=Rhizobium leguminosarum TaxID=384 RepID=A0A2K9Z0L6_RHILE|nr:hypothetical protein CUJ84_Chr001377 [Rhizobium leguminosarum]
MLTFADIANSKFKQKDIDNLSLRHPTSSPDGSGLRTCYAQGTRFRVADKRQKRLEY